MKKAIMLVGCLAISIVILSGCASVKTASGSDLNDQKLVTSQEANVAHVNADNWGLYFLKWGLFTGDVEKMGSIAVGEDTVTLPKVADLLTKESKKLGATKTADMVSSVNSMMIPFPFPFLFYIKSIQVSGNAVK